VVTVGRAHPKTSSQHNLENQFSSEPTVHRRIPGIFIPSEGRVNEKTGCVEEKLTDGMKGLSKNHPDLSKHIEQKVQFSARQVHNISELYISSSWFLFFLEEQKFQVILAPLLIEAQSCQVYS